MSQEPFTVSALVGNLKFLLEQEYSFIAVKGELTGVSLQPSGHLYFTLKDENAVLAGAFFNFRSRHFGMQPKNGDAVIVHGKLSIYPPRGQCQLVATAILHSGHGDLLLRFEEMKKRLTALGYFDESKKKPLPDNIEKIGVITSPTGAVIQDISNILTRRCRNFQIVLYPVRVQGEGAAEEIALAISQMNQLNLVDVLIVARGGGSLEDLQPFNEEIVVKAIFESSLPVISAVGHEVDFTLCDLAADIRTPTPSAAAEIVCKNSETVEKWLLSFYSYLTSHSKNFLSAKKDLLNFWRRQLNLVDFSKTASQRLDFISLSLSRATQERLYSHRRTLIQLQKEAFQGIQNKLYLYKTRIQAFPSLFSQTTLKHKKQTLFRNYERLSLLIQEKLRAARTTQTVVQKVITTTFDKKILLQNSKKQLLPSTARTLQQSIDFKIKTKKQSLKRIAEQILFSISQKLHQHKNLLSSVYEQTQTLNPQNILSRGYAMLFHFNNNSAILSIENLQPGSPIKAILCDGEVELVVKRVKKTRKVFLNSAEYGTKHSDI